MYDMVQNTPRTTFTNTWLCYPGGKCLFNPFSTNVPLKDKPVSWLLLAECLKNTCGRVTFQVRMQVIDLHLYLEFHYSTSVFQTFC